MALEDGSKHLSKRIGFRDGKPLFKVAAPCKVDGVYPDGSVVLAKRIGFRNGKPLFKIMSGECAEGSGLVDGRKYPAKRIGFRDGKPLFKTKCKQCEEAEPEFCCQCERFLTSSDQFPDELTCNVTISCGVSVSVTLNNNAANEEIDYSPGCKTYGTGGGGGQNWSVWYSGTVSTIVDVGEERFIGCTGCNGLPKSTTTFNEGYIVDVNLFCEATPCGDKWFANVIYSDLDTGSGTNERAIAGYVELQVVSCEPLELSGENTADCDADSEYDHCGPDYPSVLAPYYGMGTSCTNCDGATVTLSITE